MAAYSHVAFGFCQLRGGWTLNPVWHSGSVVCNSNFRNPLISADTFFSRWKTDSIYRSESSLEKFIIFSWPARLALGWAYRRGKNAPRSRPWWIRYPMLLASVPVAFAFAIILTLTRYVSWNGALSLFENHVFLLPAPFWL